MKVSVLGSDGVQTVVPQIGALGPASAGQSRCGTGGIRGAVSISNAAAMIDASNIDDRRLKVVLEGCGLSEVNRSFNRKSIRSRTIIQLATTVQRHLKMDGP